MWLSRLFGSLHPFDNPIGFAASDFAELAIALLLVALVLAWRPLIQPLGVRLASRTLWCMLGLAVVPVVLRLFLLAHHPVPSPDIYDEFGHLFVADTLRHFRLANPPHPFHEFFETFFILQEPTYSSIYPIGQGLMLLLGRLMFGIPWASVMLSTGIFCALCYWMLRAWTTPNWALVGGVLAVIEFGPLCQWMNSYWGGALAALSGCLVFGALPRLAKAQSTSSAVGLGIGLAILFLTRPYETLFVSIGVVLFFVPGLRSRESARALARPALIVTALLIPAAGVTLLQNKQVTGSWTTLPYQLSQYQYGVPASLTFQPDPVPHRELTPQQQLEYKSQMAFRSSETETVQSYLLRLEYRVRYYRYFFLAPLFLAIPAYFAAARQFRYLWVLVTVLLLALGVNFFPAFQAHYLAPVTCLFVLLSVVGLEQISRWSPEASRLILFVCIGHFVFWYTLHGFDARQFSMAMRKYETWDAINHSNPERRILVNRELEQIPGQLLVFVRYWPQHIFQEEWVYNEVDIDRARIVWARDLGPIENEKLRAHFPGRATLLLEPDARPPKLEQYSAGDKP